MSFNNFSSINSTSQMHQSLAYLVPEWSQDVMTIYLAIVFFLGVPGNSLIIAIHLKNQTKNVTDWFILFITISDIISLLICVPTFMIIIKQWWIYIGTTVWCRFHYFTLQTVFSSSTFFIMFVSIHRYNITLGNRIVFTEKRTVNVCILTLLVSTIFSIPAFFTTKNNEQGHCVFDQNMKHIQILSHGIGFTFTLISNITVTVLYSKIIYQIRTKMRINPVTSNTDVSQNAVVNVSNQQQMPNIATRTAQENLASHQSTYNHLKRKRALGTTKVIGLVAVVFVLSTSIPSIAGIALEALNMRHYKDGRIAIFFLTRGYLINNFINPIFYLWLYPAYRNTAGSLFPCLT